MELLNALKVTGKVALGLLLNITGMIVTSIFIRNSGLPPVLKTILQLICCFILLVGLFYLTGRFFNLKQIKFSGLKKVYKPVRNFIFYFIVFNALWLLILFLQADSMEEFVAFLREYVKHSSLNQFITVLLSAAIEEVFCRYYIIGALVSEQVNIYPAIFISSVIFSMLHGQYTIEILVPIILVGVTLAQLFILTKSLAAPLAAHVVHNLSAIHESSVVSNISFWDAFLGAAGFMVCLVVLTVIWMIKRPGRKDVLEIYTACNT
jgi:membrane protease YdiL (CAAX protease family)